MTSQIGFRQDHSKGFLLWKEIQCSKYLYTCGAYILLDFLHLHTTILLSKCSLIRNACKVRIIKGFGQIGIHISVTYLSLGGHLHSSAFPLSSLLKFQTRFNISVIFRIYSDLFHYDRYWRTAATCALVQGCCWLLHGGCTR